MSLWSLSLLLLGALGGAVQAQDKALVDLDAADLAPGPLESWPNAGSAGGQFKAINQSRPVVDNIAGRWAVRFDKAAMESSFRVPPSITGSDDFTLMVSIWSQRPSGKQVFATWGSRPWDSAEFAYGTGAEGAYCSYGAGNFGFGRLLPPGGQWHDLAFVYAPGRFAVYGGGELLVERKMTLRTKAGEPIRLGVAWDHIKKEPCFPFAGAITRLRVYERALDEIQIRNLAGRFEAFVPQPGDGAAVEDRNVALAWQAGDREAKAFEVYLGEQADAVQAADRKSKLLRTPVPVDKRALPAQELGLGKTYFWRVDQLGPDGRVARKGPVWSFTVSAGPATEPQPRDRVSAVPADLRELIWKPGRYAVTQSLYFGTDEKVVAESSQPLAKDLPASTISCPLPRAKLQPGTRYYWRVDQDNGTLPPARGEVWSFRTADVAVKDDVTFFVGSDCHYGRDEINEINSRTFDRMNALPGEPLPAQAGGGTVRTPRGVVLCGDLLDHGSDRETSPAALERMFRDIGLLGEARLAFPVFEGFGNHDGGPGSFVREAIRLRNRKRRGLTAVSPNGLHYSWDWDHVHLVQLNLFAGSGAEDVASVTAKPHDPEKALEFLRDDLARQVGASGRPVVIFQHFGLPPDGMSHWWQPAAKERFREATRPYNVAAVFHGHSHAATVYQWQGLRIIADGSTIRPDSGGGDFFVIRITTNEFIAAHNKSDGWGVAIREPLKKPVVQPAGDR